jgi:hypothetical protein
MVRKKELLDQIKTRYWIIISSKAITITVDIPLLTRFTDKIDSRMGWDDLSFRQNFQILDDVNPT